MATTPDPKSSRKRAASATSDSATKNVDSPAAGTDKQPSRSILESLRHNQVGGLIAGLTIAVAVGLLLSVLVPDEPHLLALTLLGGLMAAAVGFAVRGTSAHHGLTSQVVAFVATVIGVHLMTVTGMVGGDLPALPGGIGAEVSFNDAVVLALATPAVAVGPILAGLIAAIIAGWGAREPRQ